MTAFTDPCPLTAADVRGWSTFWAEVAVRIGPLFPRIETRHRAMAYLAALLSTAERKNGWQVAEISGARTPYGFQHLLGRAVWDADALRDRLRTYVHTHLGDAAATIVIDETGMLKKGRHSAGVGRQYSGTAGRVENCQIGVFLAYATPWGHTLLDRELYLPTAWINDPDRCQQAGIPTERAFATKPELARQMLERTFAAGVSCAWVAGDSVYGDDRPLRQWLEARLQAYVLAISRVEHLWIGAEAVAVPDLLARLAEGAWERLQSRMGSQGPIWSDWQRVELNAPEHPGWTRWVVIRRPCRDPTDLTVYRACAPTATPLADLAQVIGTRWTVEESIQTAKGEVSLDHAEVRQWTGWYRHITLAMWAQAFLAVLRHATGDPEADPQRRLGPDPPQDLIRLSCGDLRRVFWDLVLRRWHPEEHPCHWSTWRRRHRTLAAWYHTRRRARDLAAAPALPAPDTTPAPPPDPEALPSEALPEAAATPPRTLGDTEALDVLWARLEPLLPPRRRSGRQQVYDRRRILEAILHVMRTDCGWSALPDTFPPWKTVHEQFVTWRDAGIWAHVWTGLRLAWFARAGVGGSVP